MKMIDLDATQWKTPLDLHDAVCGAVGAPNWHGRGIDAMLDSMIWHDDINAVSPPFTIRIHGLSKSPQAVRTEAETLQHCLMAARSEHQQMYGRDVPVDLELFK